MIREIKDSFLRHLVPFWGSAGEMPAGKLEVRCD
jgi:hypothetical protein